MSLNLQQWKIQKKKLKITFDDLAEKTGISRRQLQYLFQGEIDNPRIETVQAIERALGLAPQWTDEEKALGAVSTPTVLSDRDLNTLGIINRAEDVLGEAYVDKMLELLDFTTEQKLKEKK